MPDDDQQALKRARKDQRQGKAPTTQAGEFIREEIHHVREGKHGVRSPQQAIAIGLSKARRAGIKVPRKAGQGQSARATAERTGTKRRRKSSGRGANRSRAITGALKREGRSAASRSALARQARSASSRRTKSQRSTAAKKAAHTRRTRKPPARSRGTPPPTHDIELPTPVTPPSFPMMG